MKKMLKIIFFFVENRHTETVFSWEGGGKNPKVRIHLQTNRTNRARTDKYFARLMRLLYSANSQMFVPVIFHFPTLSCQLINNTSPCKVPKENTLTRSKFLNFIHLVRSAGVALCSRVPPRPALRNFTPVVLKTTPALQNFAPGVHKVSVYDSLSVLVALWPKIPIWYFPP